MTTRDVFLDVVLKAAVRKSHANYGAVTPWNIWLAVTKSPEFDVTEEEIRAAIHRKLVRSLSTYPIENCIEKYRESQLITLKKLLEQIDTDAKIESYDDIKKIQWDKYPNAFLDAVNANLMLYGAPNLFMYQE
jgi:hypothetical protein